MAIDPKYRIIAGLIGALALVALVAHIALRSGRSGLVPALWWSGGYFTILTAVLTAATFLLIAWTGRRLPYGWMGMLTMSMIMVAVVYHVMLAHLFNPQGLRSWTNQVFHTLLPAAVLWFWLMEVTRHDPRAPARPLTWIFWPLGYGIYMLLRGAFTGWYPYPFLNVARLGWEGVLPNLAGLLAGFLALAYLMDYMGRRMPLRDQRDAR